MNDFEQIIDNMDATEIATGDVQRIEKIRADWRRSQAQAALWANRRISPEAETATQLHAERLKLPPKLVRRLDNRDLNRIDASNFSPEAQRAIIENPSLGIYFREQEDKLNAMFDAVYYGSLPAETRKRRVEAEIGQKGYLPDQITALQKAGYVRDADGKWFSVGKSGETAYAEKPVLPEWYLGETERAASANDAVLEALKTRNPYAADKFQDVSGRDLTRALANDITLVRYLNGFYGGFWKDFNDTELKRAVDEIAAMVNGKDGVQVLTTDNLDLSRIRERGWGEKTDILRNAGNIFEIPELAAKLIEGAPDNEELARIYNDLDNATDDEIAKLNAYLIEAHRGARGASGSVKFAENLASTLRFMGEMYIANKASKGLGKLRIRSEQEIVEGALQRFLGKTVQPVTPAADVSLWRRLASKAGLATLEEGVKTVGFYGAPIIAKELLETNNLDIGFNEAGAMEAALTPKAAGEMSANIFNSLLNQYIENLSERSGNALDMILPSSKIVDTLVPDKVKTTVVAKAVTDAFGRMNKSGWVSSMREFNRIANLNGVLPEILEEKFGDFLRTTVTNIAKGLDAQFGDLGQTDMFGHVSDEVAMMAQVAFQTSLLHAPATVGNLIERKKLANFADLQTAVKTLVTDNEKFSQSPQMVKAFYLQTGLPASAHITPAKLRELAESEKGDVILEQLGITESELASAEVNDHILTINLAEAMANLDPENHAALMKQITQVSSASVESVSDWDKALDKKAIDDRVAEAEDFTKAYDEAIAELTALDLPDSTIRAAAKIFGNFAHYLAREGAQTPADWIRNVGFNMMKSEDWENRVNQALYQAKISAPMRRELRTIAERKGLHGHTVVEALLSERASALVTERGRIELPFDGGGLHAVSRHLIETGKAATGGVTLEEIEEYLPLAHEQGERSFEKKPKVGRKKGHGRDEVGRATYIYITPEGVKYRLVTAVTQDGMETIVSFSSGRSEKDTKKMTQSAIRRGETVTLLEGQEDNIPQSDEKVKAWYQETLLKKGATSFNPSIDTMGFNETWEATITLFEGAADASTLVHEIEHYVHRMMELLVESGMASDRMKANLKTLKKWGTLSPEAAEKGYAEYVREARKKDPNAPLLSLEQWVDVQYHENVAKGLEAFIMEGKAPSVELIGAFAHLKRIMQSIYNAISALGINLNDDVRKVFRGMMAADETIEREDVLRGVVRSISESGVLGLGQDGIKSFKRLVALRNDQMSAELEAERVAQVKELRKQWTADAQQLIDEDRTMAAWQAIVKYGGMNYKAVEEIAGKETADELFKRGLLRQVKKSVSKGGTHPATFAAAHGYETVEEMLVDLLDAQSPQEFVSEYLTECEDAFNAEFAMTEKALTVQSTGDMLDAIVKDLQTLRGKEGKALRKEELRRRAELEIDLKSVAWVRSDKSLIKETKVVANELTKAISKQDYDTALQKALKLREKLELAKFKAEGKELITRFERNLRKGRSAQKGTMDGHYQDALRDLSDRLGLTKPLDRKLTATVLSVIKSFNERNPGAEIELIPEAEAGVHPINKLELWKLRELFKTEEFLRNEGRELVRTDKKQRWDAIRENTAAVVEALRKNKKHDFKEDSKLVQALSWAATLESKLRNIVGWADNWDDNGVLTRVIYDPLKKAESYALRMANLPSRKAADAMNKLAENASKWDLSAIRDIKFPEELQRRFKEYGKWDAKKVIMACLNMGNATNRQRLIDGFLWGEMGEEYCDRIGGLLSSQDWELIQQVWDAVNDRDLVSSLESVFYDIYHYEMTKEPAMSFQVRTSDGETVSVRGGYFPLQYLSSKSPKTKDEEIGKNNGGAPAEHRRPGFSHSRVEKFVAPLNLDRVTIAAEHIMDVAHYVTHVKAIRAIMPIIRSAEFRDEFVLKCGAPRYKMMVKLLENIAAPGEWMKGNVTQLEEKLRSIKVATALFGSIGTVLKQPASMLTGVEELGGEYWTAMWQTNRHFEATLNFVKSKSGFMANRIGAPELDITLMERSGSPAAGKLLRAHKWVKSAGYAVATGVDTWVILPQWVAMYNKSIKAGMAEKDAIAEADEFVAKTQGGSRPIDLSPSDLSALARSVMMFHTAASAAATSMTRTAGKIAYGKYSFQSAATAVAGNIVLPLLVEAFVSWLTRGNDDDDDFGTAYWKYVGEAVTSFTSLTDIASKTARGEVFEITALTPLKTLGRSATGVASAISDGSVGQMAYHVAELTTVWAEVPLLTAYQRIIKQAEDWADDDVAADLKEALNLKKPNRKKGGR